VRRKRNGRVVKRQLRGESTEGGLGIGGLVLLIHLDRIRGVCKGPAMQEFLKVLCVLGVMFGGTAAGVTWADRRPTPTVWSVRIVATAVAGIGLVGFLVLHFRKDRAPDYLSALGGVYYDRNGFCFKISTDVIDGCCYIRITFQTRFERGCRATIVLKPAVVFGVFERSDFVGGVFEVDCPGGGYGVTTAPLPIPKAYQGKRETFAIGATVVFPNGKGRMLRFGSKGALVVRNDAEMKNRFYGRLANVAALTGGIMVYAPARVTFTLPQNVAESVPESAIASQAIRWQLSDQSGLGPNA
jgi:hypothetical protein